MCQAETGPSQALPQPSPVQRRRRPRRRNGIEDDREQYKTSSPSYRFLFWFFGVLALDGAICVGLLAAESRSDTSSGKDRKFSLHESLFDILLCYLLRLAAALVALALGYVWFHDRENENENENDDSRLFHENGDRKSRAELDEEALEVPYKEVCRAHVSRPAFVIEMCGVASGSYLAVKCLARLNYELEHYQAGGDPAHVMHPLFWIALAFGAAFGWIEGGMAERAVNLVKRYGKEKAAEAAAAAAAESQNGGNDLSEPLLLASNESATDLSTSASSSTSSSSSSSSSSPPEDPEQPAPLDNKANARAYSGIGADPNYKASVSDLMEFCAPDKYLIFVSIGFLFMAAAANVYIPHITGQILDVLVSSDHEQGNFVHSAQFQERILVLSAVSILAGVFSGCRAAIFSLIGARVNVRLRIRLLDSLLMQELGFFDTTRTGDISSRLGSDTTLVGSSITSSVNVFLRSSARAIGTLIFMCYLSWQLSLLAFLTIPSTAMLSKWYGQYVRKMSKLQQKKLADGNSVTDATISSMATVKAFGAELLEMAEFERCMEIYLKLNRRAALATLGYGTFVGALPQLAKALVLYYGGLLVQTEQLTGGQLVTFILYLSALAESFNSLAGIYASLTRAIGGADKVFELMHREPQFTEPATEPGSDEDSDSASKHQIEKFRNRGLNPDDCQGRITLENVKLHYPARPQRTVLDGLSVSFPPGAVVALVGPSGSGKSSVVSLIQHLYEPDIGSVRIDDTDVHDLSHDWRTRYVSVVSQEPTLFARSIKRNIIYGLEGSPHEPTMEEIEEAARLANADTFIRQLPMGYDTQVGERGIQLSGGQKQRVAIARALVRKPRILLLDEATSALDSVSEHAVQSAIDDMIQSRRQQMTVVIVAHRLSTIRNADMICVIDQGKLVERGTHAELIANPDGAYAALVRRQLQIASDME